jgi:2-polyprenyl-3-methyl-5-hydroxy-6-metoxy-1,4-benzoquinol methylase
MIKKYHPYIFDTEKRQLIGKFDEMYQAEQTEGFDGWYQEDSRHTSRRLIEAVLGGFNFNNVLDIGCGKGSFTHRLKKANNQVLGLDLSETAIKVCRERYPDCQFDTLDVSQPSALPEYLEKNELDVDPVFDLTLILETFSYLENWRDIISDVSTCSRRVCTSLFLPENPIGYVPSAEVFVSEIEKYFEVTELIQVHSCRSTIVVGSSLKFG